MRLRRAAIAVGAAAMIAQSAGATWSIVVANRRTGEVGVGCATCLEGFDLLQGTPVLLTGVGGASAQSSVDVGAYNRTYLRNSLLQNTLPSTMLTGVRVGDSNANGRQYGIAAVYGSAVPATYTGPLASQWAGGVTGSFSTAQGEFTYAIQGNILSGANVVNAARDALVATPGDLPERLMAAMEAARGGGGDGRCSCTTGGPTSCGSPPPMPFKSAHVGYMVIGRVGDLDAGLSAYRAGGSPLGVAVGDVNLDGAVDVVASNNTTNNVSIFRNAAGGPVRSTRFATTGSVAFSGGPRGIALRDVTGDARPDAFVTAFSTNQVRVAPGTTAGSFGAQENATVGTGPIAVTLADLGGTAQPEVITANYLGASVSVVPITTALPTGITLGPPVTVAVGGQPIAVAAGDLDGDTDADVVAADFVGSRLVPLFNSAGTLSPGTPIMVGATPSDVIAADLDGDSDTDLAAVCLNDRGMFIVTNASGVLTPVRTPLPFAPGKVKAGDVNGDGDPDLVIMGSSAFAVYLSQGGVLSTLVVYAGTPDVQSHQWSALDLGDTDRDGDLDIVVTQAVNPGGIAIIENLGGSAGRVEGTFAAGVGLASGDHYLSLNVANTSAGDPDPVVTLQQQFDAWRTALVGVPDAIQSTVNADRGIIQPGCPGVMTVTLRDWQGTLVTAPVSVTVAGAVGSTPALTIGAAVQVSPGVFEVPLSVQTIPASVEDELVVRVEGGGMVRPVVLMPSVRVRALREALHDIDFNNDGLFPDTADLDSLLCVFAGGVCDCDPVLHCDSIDFNQDNIFPDFLDLDDFIAAFAGRGC